jgi:hypothetical protein
VISAGRRVSLEVPRDSSHMTGPLAGMVEVWAQLGLLARIPLLLGFLKIKFFAWWLKTSEKVFQVRQIEAVYSFC